MGVNGEDLISASQAAVRTMMEEKGWTIEFDDEGVYQTVTLMTNE
jgi:hypothetical protein